MWIVEKVKATCQQEKGLRQKSTMGGRIPGGGLTVYTQVGGEANRRQATKRRSRDELDTKGKGD